MFTEKEIEDLATKMAMEVYPQDTNEDLGQMRFLRDTFMRNAKECINILQSNFAIVSKDFINRQRQIIQHDKKMMTDNNPDGARMALAGLYQAELELMDKLFGNDI